MKEHSKSKNTNQLPIFALLALAMAGFICILTETIPAGLLPQISSDLNVSTSLAGQMVTFYAIGSLVAAIPLTILTQQWSRRLVLLTTVVGFLIFNTLTALSNSVFVIMCARFFAGAVAGLAWSLIAGYARRMVAPALQGRALAVAMIGTPIALSLGVPAGTWLGDLMGWRLTFMLMSGLSILLIVWIICTVPDYPGQVLTKKSSLVSVLRIRGIVSILSVVLMWMTAHNILYTYIAPFLSKSNLTSSVDVVLLVFGFAALIGIYITSRIVDTHLRNAVLISLSVFAFISVIFGLFSTSPTVVYLGIAVWGLTFGGAATLLQTALADTAGEYADIALSLNVVTWNSAIALGGILGGLLIKYYDVGNIPWVLALLLTVAFIIALQARHHGFPMGRRSS